MVPETQLGLGSNVTSSISVMVGYVLLCDSSVIRPGDNIDRDLPEGRDLLPGRHEGQHEEPGALFNTGRFLRLRAQPRTVGNVLKQIRPLVGCVVALASMIDVATHLVVGAAGIEPATSPV